MEKVNGIFKEGGRISDFRLIDRNYQATHVDIEWMKEAVEILKRNGRDYSFYFDGDLYEVGGFIFPCAQMCASWLKARLNEISMIRRY